MFVPLWGGGRDAKVKEKVVVLAVVILTRAINFLFICLQALSSFIHW